MLNKIVDGIVQAISSVYGDGYEIYTERVEQGLTEPCFLIECINLSSEQFMGRRYKQTTPFCIHYFPKGPDKSEENNAVFMVLTDCLEYISVDGQLVRGTGMHAEWDGDVMHFMVDYDMFLIRPDDAEKMGDYSLEMEVNGEKDLN